MGDMVYPRFGNDLFLLARRGENDGQDQSQALLKISLDQLALQNGSFNFKQLNLNLNQATGDIKANNTNGWLLY